MRKIAFITPQDAEFGFNLTGADQFIANRDSLIPVLNSIILKPGTGLIIIDERLISIGNEEKLRETERTWNGILIVMPSPERPKEVIEDYASRLIRRAIGYHVRLKI